VSDKVLEPSAALKGVVVSEEHVPQTCGSRKKLSSNIAINRHFVECGTYDGALNFFALVKIKSGCNYCVADAIEVIATASGRGGVSLYTDGRQRRA
jgi:hypothetical protein